MGGDAAAAAIQDKTVKLSGIAMTILSLSISKVEEIVDCFKGHLPARSRAGETTRFPTILQLANSYEKEKKQHEKDRNQQRGHGGVRVAGAGSAKEQLKAKENELASFKTQMEQVMTQRKHEQIRCKPANAAPSRVPRSLA